MINSGTDKTMERVVRKFKATFLKIMQKEQLPVIETDFDEKIKENKGKETVFISMISWRLKIEILMTVRHDDVI